MFARSDYLLLAIAEAEPSELLLPRKTSIEPLVAAMGIEVDVECAIRYDVPLLLTGGDDGIRLQLAEFIHNRSVRRSGPFAIFAASPEAGGRAARWHARIAARGTTITISETISDSLDIARHGTLFIPEICAATPDQQSDLADFFKRRAAYRGEIGIDARVITGTSCPLTEDVARARLESALFYHMNTVHIAMPVDPTVRSSW